ncbi:hypothetical protein [Avibacterium paragallinarum]|uniref:Toxin-antitoxin system HicB family antitoxin n=1 Tax=Avibacterium paragallinarum TaxID=728 RepID=A0A377I5W3_AVIPA|nr:hypothetical protein [Avibacterium paragallinarum]RZN74769.1 hypothetical protein EC523_11015 [Avibacterium paragallinarum]CDF98039.1 Putative uncharacterized protein [Avibacterium paragallinarum JF4211]STO70149.1 Uncharacterised protein [Avibacterium paragallinarum]
MERPAKRTPLIRLTRAVNEQVQRLATEERRKVTNMVNILLEDALKARGIELNPVQE